MSGEEILKQLEEAFNYMANCKVPPSYFLVFSDMFRKKMMGKKEYEEAFIYDCLRNNVSDVYFTRKNKSTLHYIIKDRKLVLVDDR